MTHRQQFQLQSMKQPGTLTKKSNNYSHSNTNLKQTVAPQKNIKYSPASKTPEQHKQSQKPNQFSQSTLVKKDESFNIINYLTERDKKKYAYRNFKNLSKESDLKETIYIIEQLLDKHAELGSISTSEQYILIGYLAKYLQFTKKQPRGKDDPFNISQRIETGNKLISSAMKNRSHSSPRAKSKSKKRIGYVTEESQQKQELGKAFLRLKFLWQIYQLKCLVCPLLSRRSERQQSQSHRQMIEMMERLKEIQKSRFKVGEVKTRNEVGKVMRRFEQKIKSILC